MSFQHVLSLMISSVASLFFKKKRSMAKKLDLLEEFNHRHNHFSIIMAMSGDEN